MLIFEGFNRYFSSLSLGEQHSCGLNEKGEILCWGDNYYGQSEPQEVQFKALSSGGNGNCGISEASGKVLCWGENRKYESAPPGGSCRGATCVWPDNISTKVYRKVSKGKYTKSFTVPIWGKEEPEPPEPPEPPKPPEEDSLQLKLSDA